MTLLSLKNPAPANRRDLSDPLRSFRSRFYIPEKTVYMDGNSLGLLSSDGEASLGRVIGEWRRLGIRGWLDAGRPWFRMAEEIGEMASGLVGAAPGELVVSGGTTVNIHALVSTFFQPRRGRSKILADALNFPSDTYALQGQLRLHGLDPADHLILAPGRDGRLLDEETIVSLMGPEVALIWLPSVLYASGQLLDMEGLTREAHQRGIEIGFDCSHSAGAVPHRLHEWGVDFATFCGYKYLNGGPGSPAFLYVHQRHFDRHPMLPGWFGYVKDRQFDMSPEFDHARSAGGWQISTPGIIGMAAMEGSLRLFREAGMEALREKSLALTGYLMELVDACLPGGPDGFAIVTPREADRRGGHVALAHPTEALRINEALKARGIIPDFRGPDTIRIAPVPLYNTFGEVWQVVRALKEIMETREYERFPNQRHAVS
jgi:kynureninase